MPVLSQPDPSAQIACALPPGEFVDRLRALESVVGDRLEDVTRDSATITFRLTKTDDTLETRLATWAKAEKSCCAFLGFALDSTADSVSLTIEAPAGAEATLDGIDWIVRAAAQRGAVT